MELLLLEDFIKSALSEYGLLVAVLMLANVIQWRKSQAITDRFIEISVSTTKVIERLTQRIEDMNK